MSNTGSAVATITSGADTSKPTIVFKSVGSFSIRADASSSANYTIAHTISEPIDVSKDTPIVDFLSIYNSSYPYQYNTPYEFVTAPAYIQNNTGQTLTYSIVTEDSTVASFITSTEVATITPDGKSFITNKVGKFKIRAYTPKTSNGDFGKGSALSYTIEITQAKPTILQYPQIILTPPVTASTLVYGQQYTINPLPITVTGIATQYIMLGTGAYNYGSLSYSSYCNNVPNSTCHAEYRLRFSNGIVSNLTLTSDSSYGLTNPDLLFALSNVPFEGVSAILQGLNISTGSDNLWYDIDVPEQFITQSVSTVKFSGNTGNFNSTPSSFQTSVSTISSNTDTNPPPNINYTSSDATIATISGTTVTIVGIGHFQIMVTVSPTTNYNQILRSPSPQIYETIQAIPAITSFPTTALSAQKWIYNQSYSEIIPIANNIPTTNTDINPAPNISYSTINKTIATILGNTITITGVGNFQILVTIHSTTNFSAVTYTYPSPSTYYNTEWATPIITFPPPPTFITSSKYGSTYNFVAAILSNNDPSQVIQYTIINSIPPSTTSVATLVYKSGVTNPSVVINSVGTFQIQASCAAFGFYSSQVTPSLVITIANEIPIIVFNTANFNNSYSYQNTTPYTFRFSNPFAYIKNNSVQTLTYSIVATDGITPSTVATIYQQNVFFNGISLTTNRVGSFQILATATATSTGDYGGASLPSETITIVSATPTITTFPTLPSTFIYGNTYTIPSTITTSNTDTAPAPVISYSSNNSAIVSISGKSITIVGVGNFQINVIIGATENYNSPTYVYPSSSTYYTSIHATPTITFPSNFGSGWVFRGTYNLTSTVTTNSGSGYTDSGQVFYTIINPSVSNIATINTSGSGSQITINDAGTFQIQANLATTTNFTAAASVKSNTITILSTTPTIPSTIATPSSWLYGNTYSITYPTSSNTDTPGPIFLYTIINQTSTVVATVSGIAFTVIGVGNFQISVTIGATENYNSATYVYPTPTTYYTSVPATPTITFPSNVGSEWVLGGTYNLTSTVTTNAGSGYTVPNQVLYSIINPSVTNIATILVSGSQIKINDAGTFQIQAFLNQTTNFKAAASVSSNTITIVTLNVSILSNNFSNFVYSGGPYTLSVTTNNTDQNPYPTITYRIYTPTGSTGNGTISGNSLTITAAGGVAIYVTISSTANFNATTIPVFANIAQAVQVFSLNTTWLNTMVTSTTVQSSFSASGAILPGSSNNTDSPVPTYSFAIIGSGIASLNSGMINCIAPGSFVYSITASATANFSAVTINTPTIYVCNLPEIIIFNNPRAWPVVTSISGEVGIAVGFPTGSYPSGFQDYTEVTITINNQPQTQFSTTTTPSFSQLMSSGLYTIWINLNTVNTPSFLSQTWNYNLTGNMGPILVENIGISTQIASGAASIPAGTFFTFTFTGQTTGSGPSSLTVNWSAGSNGIIVPLGQIYGSYYSIAPGVAPFNFSIPQGMTINTGNYTVGWSGYGIPNPDYFPYSVSTSSPAEAWGVSVYTYVDGYTSYQPLMSKGNYYAPAPDSNGNAFYLGIPKILYNNY